MARPQSLASPTRSDRFQQTKPRESSDDSDSSCNSTSSVYDSDEEEYEEEDEVSNWLLQSDNDTRTPHYASTSTKSDSPPFILFNAPGPLILQLIYWLMIYFDLPSSRPIPPVIPSSQSGTLDLSAWPPSSSAPYHPLHGNWDGTRSSLSRKNTLSYHYSPAFYEEDDTEYLVPPTPGTNEEIMRIRVSSKLNVEKVAKQPRDALHIYRIQSDYVMTFAAAASRCKFLGQAVRRPLDVFDTISVVRHGHVSWDLGPKDECWMLVGEDHHAINRVLQRIERRKPPFMKRIGHFICKNTYAAVSPWLPKNDWSF